MAQRFPRVEILSYVSATAYKRRRQHRLMEDIEALARWKPHVLVRAPLGAWQWTFLLWSSWDAYPDWKKRGFFKLTSPEGRAIVDCLNLTKAEWLAKFSPRLWEDEPGA